MELARAVPTEFLGHQVAFVFGYVSALRDTAPDDIVAKKAVREKFNELAEICRKILPTIKKRTGAKEDRESIEREYQTVANVVDSFADVLKYVEDTKFSLDGIISKADWEIFVQTYELFEEAQETLALGLSPEFRKHISEARREAGLDELPAD